MYRQPIFAPTRCSCAALKRARGSSLTDKARIGYVHVWSYASHRMQLALEDLMSDGPLKDADALVWDLRGGWGGAQPHIFSTSSIRARPR